MPGSPEVRVPPELLPAGLYFRERAPGFIHAFYLAISAPSKHLLHEATCSLLGAR